jgi:CheY-like chemotaxis protein
VTCAAGGAEALARIEKAPQDFEVIVTDFAMPLVSGLDVIRFARNLKADWPAVIITGYADTKAIGDLPADVPLLAKPFKDEELVESILQAKQTRGRT